MDTDFFFLVKHILIITRLIQKIGQIIVKNNYLKLTIIFFKNKYLSYT